MHRACHVVGVPKDSSPESPPAPRDLTPLGVLRAAVAELRKRVPDLKVERIEGSADTKPHVKASWGRTRVADVADSPRTLDQCEIAVLEVVLSNLGAL